ncbi:hypothetical protein WME90_24040 [Sorangium sp. So ce375]|uniref:hypothetical protein n=1 Tax=Sorangium sp. So ce375 TaxID=3133306 RepID=UPI003F5AEA9F
MKSVKDGATRISLVASALLSASSASAATVERPLAAEPPPMAGEQAAGAKALRTIFVNIKNDLTRDAQFRSEFAADPRQAISDRGISRSLQQGLLDGRLNLPVSRFLIAQGCTVSTCTSTSCTSTSCTTTTCTTTSCTNTDGGGCFTGCCVTA